MTLKKWNYSLLCGLSILASVARAEEFVVGVHLPLTGSMARTGLGVQQGLTVAAELFNRNGGKYTIKLVTIDDETQPPKGIAAVEKLAAEGAVAITGGYGSPIVGPASEAADKAGLVYLTSGSADERMSRRGFKGFFRINGNADVYPKALAQLITEQGLTSISLMYSTKKATTDLANDLTKLLGSKVKVTLQAFDSATTDYKPLITKIKLQDKPDAIVMSAYESDYIGILRAAKVVKPAVKAMIGAWVLLSPKMVTEFPDLMNNVYGTASLTYPSSYTSAEGKSFHDAYRKLYNSDPDYTGHNGYMQGTLLFKAIARAADKGTLKQKNGLAEELRAVPVETLSGPLKFDEFGDNILFRESMGQFQNGKIQVVSPKERATAKMVFPAVPW